MSTSQNGWPALAPDATVPWVIPFKTGPSRYLRLCRGHAGFILTYFALWFSEVVEPLNLGIWDEWAYSYRSVRGSDVISNHASGTAIDLNATLHPLSKRGTFTKGWQYVRIRAKLASLGSVIRWGGDYSYRADEMHFEINVKPRTGSLRRLARVLSKTKRGRRVIQANKHYER
jgi:hypothetical protein